MTDNLELEKTRRQDADKLRNNMDAAEYKYVVLGLIFLKYIADVFDELYKNIGCGEKCKRCRPRRQKIACEI